MSNNNPQLHIDQPKKINKKLIAILIISFIVTLVGARLFAGQSWGVFSFEEDLASNWNDIFTKYIFIIVALERASSVWTGLYRNKMKRSWDRRVKRVRDLLDTPIDKLSLADLKMSYNRENLIVERYKNQDGFLGIDKPGDGNDEKGKYNKDLEKEDLVANLRMTKYFYEFSRTMQEEETYEITTRIVFVGGVALSIIGLSLFNDIIDLKSLEGNLTGHFSQMFGYRLADIVITGGLLGGGSKGLSMLMNTLNQFFNKIQDPQGEK